MNDRDIARGSLQSHSLGMTGGMGLSWGDRMLNGIAAG